MLTCVLAYDDNYLPIACGKAGSTPANVVGAVPPNSIWDIGGRADADCKQADMQGQASSNGWSVSKHTTHELGLGAKKNVRPVSSNGTLVHQHSEHESSQCTRVRAAVGRRARELVRTRFVLAKPEPAEEARCCIHQPIQQLCLHGLQVASGMLHCPPVQVDCTGTGPVVTVRLTPALLVLQV